MCLSNLVFRFHVDCLRCPCENVGAMSSPLGFSTRLMFSNASLGFCMREAYAYVLPMRWQEAFGLTMVESLASGTPAIVFDNGAAPEVIDDGRTGYVVSSVEQAVEAIGKVSGISRAECRRQAVERFDVSRMARDYLTLYSGLASH